MLGAREFGQVSCREVADYAGLDVRTVERIRGRAPDLIASLAADRRIQALDDAWVAQVVRYRRPAFDRP